MLLSWLFDLLENLGGLHWWLSFHHVFCFDMIVFYNRIRMVHTPQHSVFQAHYFVSALSFVRGAITTSCTAMLHNVLYAFFSVVLPAVYFMVAYQCTLMANEYIKELYWLSLYVCTYVCMYVYLMAFVGIQPLLS